MLVPTGNPAKPNEVVTRPPTYPPETHLSSDAVKPETAGATAQKVAQVYLTVWLSSAKPPVIEALHARVTGMVTAPPTINRTLLLTLRLSEPAAVPNGPPGMPVIF